MDTVTGETLEHRQLRRHPKYKKTWNQSYSNELGRLCQGIGKVSKGPNASRELIFSGSSKMKISSTTAVTRSRAPKLCGSIEPKKKIPTKRGSPLEETAYATPGTLTHLQARSNLSNLSSTASSPAGMRTLQNLTSEFFTWPRRWINQNFSEFALKKFHKSLLRNIISPPMQIMYGSAAPPGRHAVQ